MDYKIVLADSFFSDLKSIVDYLNRKADSETARRVGNELIDAALGLAPNPAIGQIYRRSRGARRILVYSYAIIYDVDEDARVVNVLRIWHTARNPRSLRLPKLK